MKFPTFLWLLCTVLPVSAFAQKGVLLYKDAPWDADQFVQVTPYKAIERFPTVHNVTSMTGNKIRVKSALVVKEVVFPTAASLTDLSEEAQIKPLEATVAEWTALIKRYPATAKHLNPRITQLQGEIAHFRAGSVKVAGIWTSKEELQARQQKAEEERRKLAAQLEEEAKQLGMAAVEWASLDEAARLRAREAKIKAEEAQMRIDEERRLQNEIEKQKKIAEARAKMKPVERLATDTWVMPPGLNEQQTKEYEAAQKLVHEQLTKAHQNLGFGKEAQRMVLKTEDRVYAFRPAELSPEVQIVSPEEKDKPSVIVMGSPGQEEVIEALPVDGSEGAMVASITLPTTPETDIEKLVQGLSQMVEICGGKREAAKKEEPQP